MTCNQTLALQNVCQKPIWWNYCDKMFSNRKKVKIASMKHMNQSLVDTPKKNKVKKTWINCSWEGRINNEEVSGN